MSAEDDGRFDGVFMSVIQQKGGIDGFFSTIFSFLRRSTDFFTDQKKAEKVMIQECTKQFEIYNQDSKVREQKEKERKAREEQLKAQKQKQQEEEKLKKEATSEQKKQEVVDKQKQGQILQQKIAEAVSAEEKKEQDGEKKEEEDKTPPPIGNGGKTEKYIWTQTLEELSMNVFIPDNIRARDLVIQIDPKSLLIQIKGQPEPLVKGEWTENIVADNTVWTVEDGEVQDYKGKYIHISVDKWKNQWHWWNSPIKGDPTINTQKIQPENSKLSDLDGETKSTVEKMMFDMRQKQMGKPSSDELKKQEMLSGFMKQHPEMDFSKVKFN